MGVINRIKMDYFGKSKYSNYDYALSKAISDGYKFFPVLDFNSEEYLKTDKTVILRHDIDSDVSIAKKLFKIEKKYGIKSTYYFRLSTVNKKFIKELMDYGNEVGYHFEEISSYAYRKNLGDRESVQKNIGKIQSLFKKNLEAFRIKTGSKCLTVCSHGDFVNRKLKIINNELLTKGIRQEVNILKEAYDSDLLENTVYVSDTKSDFWERFNSLSDNRHYSLVHPRSFAPNFFVRLGLDTSRAYKGFKFAFMVKLKKLFRKSK